MAKKIRGFFEELRVGTERTYANFDNRKEKSDMLKRKSVDLHSIRYLTRKVSSQIIRLSNFSPKY